MKNIPKETNSRPFLPQLNIIRALAILSVITVHSTSSAVAQLDKHSALYPVYNFINIFFRVGTPTFIFLSAFVLFYSYMNRPLSSSMLKRFYKNRFLYILIPYVLFSLLYFIPLALFIYDFQTIWDALQNFFLKLATGKAYAHLYFVFINIQFYLMFPLLLWMFKSKPKLLIHSLWIGFLIQWAFYLLNHTYFEFQYKGSISFSYFSYYFAGAFMGIYYQKVLRWLRGWRKYVLWAAWLSAALFHVYVYQTTRVDGKIWDMAFYEGAWNVHTILTAFVLFHLGFLIYDKTAPKLLQVLSRIGAYSFGIYLLHPFILLVYRRLITVGDPVGFHLYTAAGWFLAFGISWASVTIAFRYIPLAWLVFGSNPDSSRNSSTHRTSRRA
ncbi:acyltransferase [Marinicrinis lubricantis]|uniref:Acyltransferase n=1 Tax=Marinicrinis lubricantis TaxID=2086470 RepID=A0ABW1IJ29_9BACL